MSLSGASSTYLVKTHTRSRSDGFAVYLSARRLQRLQYCNAVEWLYCRNQRYGALSSIYHPRTHGSQVRPQLTYTAPYRGRTAAVLCRGKSQRYRLTPRTEYNPWCVVLANADSMVPQHTHIRTRYDIGAEGGTDVHTQNPHTSYSTCTWLAAHVYICAAVKLT